MTEEQILRHYLGIPVVYGVKFKSPLRLAKSPSCFFRERPTGIYLKDFKNGYHGDCFDIVQTLRGVNYNGALSHIATDFGLVDGTPAKHVVPKYRDCPVGKKHFQIRRREWTLEDKNFWSEVHLTRKDLNKFNVIPLKVLWIDDDIMYTYRKGDPAYAYYFGNGDYKIYFPNRRQNRFLSNGPHLQGWREIDLSTDHVFITKSLKDVMVLNKMGFAALAPPGEGAYIKPYLIEFLEHYDTTILFDNDSTGIEWAKNNSLRYHMPFFYYNEAFVKDTSDLVKMVGLEKAREIINQYLKQRKYVKETNSGILECQWAA